MHIDTLAAQHLLTIHDTEATGEAIQSSLNWIDNSPYHLMAFTRTERFMRACDAIDPDELSRLKLSPMRPKPVGFSFRRKMAALAASILLIVIASLAMQKPDTFVETHYATPPDVIHSIRLADGSNITLGGASAVTVKFQKKTREIRLLSGEALFSVMPDRNRPFIVQTENGSTTAIGTAFNIHRGIDGTTVTVLHGRVEVLARGAGYISRATLDKAMEVKYSGIGEMGAIKRVDPEMIAAWQRGKFRYANTPLAAVVDDLNRYSVKPIIIENPSLGQIKISGVVTVDGILEWLGALPAITDVQIIETPRDIRIRSRST